jgi:DNA-binding GntR family transcriptional regulator
MGTRRSPGDARPAGSPAAIARPPARARSAGRAKAIRLNENEIYRRICDAVLDHRLQPGTKLREVALAEAFGANRGVVRKVLTRLAYDRLVALRPNRGAVVAIPSVEEARDLFAARRAAEAAIVDAVTRNIARAELKELRALAESEREAYRCGEVRKGLKLSLKFHRQLAAIAGNGVLAEFLDQLIARTPLVVLAYRGRGADRTCSIDEHIEIIDAIATGNVATAVAAMTSHLEGLEGQLDLSDDTETSTDLVALFGADGD